MAEPGLGKLREVLYRFRGDPIEVLQRAWATLWMTFAGQGMARRPSSWLAGLAVPPYYGRHQLALLHPRGYTAPSAQIYHSDLRRGTNTSLADRVVIYQDAGGGHIGLGDRCTVNRDSCMQTGQGGAIEIGSDTHIQSRCQFSAYIGSIFVGDQVSIAPNCSFYPYDHKVATGQIIREQGLYSKGDIRVGDDVWIASGSVILAGVTIGTGAIVGAGSVVTTDIPEDAIAAGIPARIVGYRS
jgi:UDP-3-O-[3-hydroxymyristoyl] glucosamine N-acyltransferase